MRSIYLFFQRCRFLYSFLISAERRPNVGRHKRTDPEKDGKKKEEVFGCVFFFLCGGRPFRLFGSLLYPWPVFVFLNCTAVMCLFIVAGEGWLGNVGSLHSRAVTTRFRRTKRRKCLARWNKLWFVCCPFVVALHTRAMSSKCACTEGKKKKNDEWRIGRCVRHRDFEGCGGQARALPRRGFFAPVVLSLRYVEGRGGNAQNHFRVFFFFSRRCAVTIKHLDWFVGLSLVQNADSVIGAQSMVGV